MVDCLNGETGQDAQLIADYKEHKADTEPVQTLHQLTEDQIVRGMYKVIEVAEPVVLEVRRILVSFRKLLQIILVIKK